MGKDTGKRGTGTLLAEAAFIGMATDNPSFPPQSNQQGKTATAGDRPCPDTDEVPRLGGDLKTPGITLSDIQSVVESGATLSAVRIFE